MKKIITQNELAQLLDETENKKIVLVGGCFDILHLGHFSFLTAAKKLGDTLVLLLESDQSVTSKKGEERPINDIATRSHNLLNQAPVDFIVTLPFPFGNNDYDNLVTAIKPAIIATTKGDPYINHKRRQAKKIGAQVKEVIERLGDHSTTNSLK